MDVKAVNSNFPNLKFFIPFRLLYTHRNQFGGERQKEKKMLF